MPTDAELLAAVAAGDRRAFVDLYQRHAPWLVLRLGRRCADPGLVDEAVQDTFVAVWQAARKWDGRGEVAAWVWGIGVRRLIDGLRKHRPVVVAEADRELVASAEEQVLIGVEYGELGRALGHLSPELRSVIEATALDGLTTKEAGQLLGIPAGTVKSRLVRARAALREELA
jgi:RNA polymerase sigma-70 factor, ECF subfamily